MRRLYSELTEDQNEADMEPVRKFAAISRDIKEVRFAPINVGKGPDSRLLVRESSVRWGKTPKSEGTVPVKWLTEKSKCRSFVWKKELSFRKGKLPVKLFDDIVMIFKCCNSNNTQLGTVDSK